MLLALGHFRRRATPITRRQWIVLGLLAAIFAWGTWRLRGSAEEAMHLPQYGVLSLLLYRAFSRRYGDRGAYVCSALAGAFLGIFDEVIQWAVPLRFFEFRDIRINVLSVLLIQAALVGGLATGVRAVPAGIRSARMAWSLAVLVLLLLFGCFSNTTSVWRPLQAQWPNLFVFGEAMVHYGHRIRDPEAGRFKSRLTAKQLRESDRTRAEEAGEILRRFGGDDVYELFLGRYGPEQDPFLYEMRVRLFRRDRYWTRAQEKRHRPAKEKEFLAIAFTEQQLLENWFPNSLRAAGRDWSPEQRARAAAVAGGEHRESQVSRELLTGLTQPQAQMILVALLVVVALAGAYDSGRRRRKGMPLP